MADRLAYQDVDKRIYVTREATEVEPQQERVEWREGRWPVERRMADVEDRLGQAPTADDLEDLKARLGGKPQ